MEQMTIIDYLLPAALGVGLAAASGFRVFIPLLVMGLAARGGYFPVSEGFAWITSVPALLMLAVAAIVEVLAYFIPGLDNLLDTAATPVAIVSGIAISAAVMTDLPPMLKWTLAIIAGGGAAGLTQSATALLRGGSTVTTGGLGNGVIAVGEIIGAIGVSILAVMAPWIGLLAAALLCVLIYRTIRTFGKRRAGNS
jgi:hypothetical protein